MSMHGTVAVRDRTSPTGSITVQMPRDVYNAVDALAKERRVSKSALLRDWIEERLCNMAALYTR